MRKVYQHEGHGAIGVSSHGSEALMQGSCISEEGANVRGRRMTRN
jgi:hypothetical protein